MKKIHKKVGAMALAAMVVSGGIAVSGVQSHAVSFNVGLSQEQRDNQRNAKLVKDICDKLEIEIIVSSRDSRKIDKVVNMMFRSKKYEKVRKRLLDIEKSFESEDDADFIGYISRKRYGRVKFHRIKFGGVEYLFKF